MPHLVPSIPVPDSLQPPKGMPRLLTWQLGIPGLFFVSTKEFDVIVVLLDVFKYWNNRVWLVVSMDDKDISSPANSWTKLCQPERT